MKAAAPAQRVAAMPASQVRKEQCGGCLRWFTQLKHHETKGCPGRQLSDSEDEHDVLHSGINAVFKVAAASAGVGSQSNRDDSRLVHTMGYRMLFLCCLLVFVSYTHSIWNCL